MIKKFEDFNNKVYENNWAFKKMGDFAVVLSYDDVVSNVFTVDNGESGYGVAKEISLMITRLTGCEKNQPKKIGGNEENFIFTLTNPTRNADWEVCTISVIRIENVSFQEWLNNMRDKVGEMERELGWDD
jgi:hypothetical protein